MKPNASPTAKPIRARSRLLRAFVAIALLVASGCVATRPEGAPLDPPAMPVTLEHHAGTPWTGPLPSRVAASSAAPRPALPLRCRIAVVDADSGPVPGDPIGARARLIVATRGIVPILGAANAAEEIRIESDAAFDFGAARTGPVSTVFTALPDGVTATVVALLGDRFAFAERPILLFGVAAARVEGGISLVAEMERVFPLESLDVGPSPPDTAAPSSAPVLVLADFAAVLVPGGPPVVLSAPAPFEGHPGARVVLAADVPGGVTSDDLAAALEKAEHAADRSAGLEAERGPLSTAARFQARMAAGALEAMADPASRRSAIVLLADACGSVLGADTAIAAEDAVLERYAAALAQALGEGDAARLDAEWAFERATYRFLVTLREELALSPALLAVVARHAGEAARFPATLLEIADAATGFEDMAARLTEENEARLDDSNEAVRVRAFDWLERRGAAPAGFDPLAPRDDRRAILRRLADERNAAVEAEAAARAAAEKGRP